MDVNECTGVVNVIYVGRKAYVIYGPISTETAREKIEELMRRGYDVVPLNEGVREEEELADALREKYCKDDEELFFEEPL